MKKISLHMGGGGARGAFQVGALKAISEILQTKELPFSMLTGVSIGAVNAAILAQEADNFPAGIAKLEKIWREIHCNQVFNTSNYQLGKSVFRNLRNIISSNNHAGYLLDTAPLNRLIQENIDFQKIQYQIDRGHLETFEIITNCYNTHQTVSFYQHQHKDFVDWYYPKHLSERSEINIQHILASSALPLFFPAMNINGYHYGDGSMGLISPLRGAIRFNVHKILVLGTQPLPLMEKPEAEKDSHVGYAQVLGNILSSIFLDNLDKDIEMVNRMNEIAEQLSLWKKWKSPWRPIETVYLRPKTPLSPIAQNSYYAMPAVLRFFLNIMGAKNHAGDLLSFLLFEQDYTNQVLDLGYQETMANKEALLAFFT